MVYQTNLKLMLNLINFYIINIFIVGVTFLEEVFKMLSSVMLTQPLNNGRYYPLEKVLFSTPRRVLYNSRKKRHERLDLGRIQTSNLLNISQLLKYMVPLQKNNNFYY